MQQYRIGKLLGAVIGALIQGLCQVPGAEGQFPGKLRIFRLHADAQGGAAGQGGDAQLLAFAVKAQAVGIIRAHVHQQL